MAGNMSDLMRLHRMGPEARVEKLVVRMARLALDKCKKEYGRDDPGYQVTLLQFNTAFSAMAAAITELPRTELISPELQVNIYNVNILISLTHSALPVMCDFSVNIAEWDQSTRTLVT